MVIANNKIWQQYDSKLGFAKIIIPLVSKLFGQTVCTSSSFPSCAFLLCPEIALVMAMVALVRRKWQYYKLRTRRRERGQYCQYNQYYSIASNMIGARRRKRGHPIISFPLPHPSVTRQYAPWTAAHQSYFLRFVFSIYFKYCRRVVNCFDRQILFTVCLIFEVWQKS